MSKGDMSGLTIRGGHKRSTESGAGMTRKGVNAYRRKNPRLKIKDSCNWQSKARLKRCKA